MKDNLLELEFNYEEDIFIMNNLIDGTPIKANEIYFKILGQEFIEYFDIHRRDHNKGYETKRSYAKMFGKKLHEIGRMIELQATHGKPNEVVINGKKIISF